jgi:phosphomannomutase
MIIDQSIFKAYDIRGVYPDTINEELAYKIAQAYIHFINPEGKKLNIVMGRDVRTSGPQLSEAMKKGILDCGCNVIEIGLASTDMMYFAVANYGYDGGLQITASHNPREFNGVKMVRKGAVPISGDTGIYTIRDFVLADYSQKEEQAGTVQSLEILSDYVEKVLSVVDTSIFKPMHVVANINFGYTAAVLKELEKHIPVTFTMINENPNGEFPKGAPDPLLISNRGETIELIKQTKPHFGAAWDSDADRCYFFDETGRFLSGYFTSAILAGYFLEKYPGSKVVIDMKQNWAIKDVVGEAGGVALQNRTGHSLFKERMIKEDAVFGGEVSGHFFFKDFFYLDNGIIPFLLILEILSTSGKKLSEIYQPLFDKYFAIEEENLEVSDVPKVLQAIKEKYKDGVLSEIDGVSIDYPEWRFNIRSSNTQPLLRLNLEAKNKELMEIKEKEVSEFIKHTM